MTARYGVIGQPVAHSKSPRIHTLFAQQTGHDISYDLLPAPLDGFAPFVAGLIERGFAGANVTVPFKQEAFALATSHSAAAQAAGAVNTLIFDNGQIRGDNTDGVGLVRDLTANLGIDLRGKRVLLLGAGGAARGVIRPLQRAGVAGLVLANRTLATAQSLALAFDIEALPLDACGADHDLVINATSAGLQGAGPSLPHDVWRTGMWAYDMLYGAKPSAFLQTAAQGGAQCADGLGMLVEQAAESFALWRAVRPQTAPVLALLRAELHMAA
jgi:shikimate dehydrogenase